MTQNPEVFQSCIDVFVDRYKDLDVDVIAGLDARGFVLGPPIALALKKPFVMIRKKGSSRMPCLEQSTLRSMRVQMLPVGMSFA